MSAESVKTKILLVEDNPLDAKLLIIRLESAGIEKFTIHHVTSIQEAQKVLGAETFDLILLDMTLPDSKGFETFEIIHSIAADTAIVSLTGLDDEELAIKTIQAGAQDYLVKGQINVPQLLKAIRRSIERNEMVSALKESQARHRILIENTLGFIVTHDLQGNLLSVNPAAARSLGYKPEEAVGKNLSVFIQEQYRPMLQQYLDHIKKHSTGEGMIYLQSKDGEKHIWEYRNLLFKQGKEQYVISFAHDITKRNQMEKQFKETNQELENTIQELQKRTMEGTILNEMTDLLLACQTSDDVYNLSISTIQQLFGNTFAGAIYELTPDQSNIKVMQKWGNFIPLKDQFSPDSCFAIQTRKMYRSNQIDTHCPHAIGTKSHSTLCIPLAAEQMSFGFIYLERPEPISNAEVIRRQETLTITVAEQMRLALANVHLREDLRNQAIRDPLTGLFNRRYLVEWLERELLRTARYDRPLSVAFLDIDNFKTINDTYGHNVGDEVLRKLGQMIREILRRTDIKSRYGGEEFVVVFPETSISDAKNLGEKIRENFQQIIVQTESGTLKDMTVSIGIAGFPEHASNLDDLISCADRAVYRAKNEGKNRVIVFDHRDSE